MKRNARFCSLAAGLLLATLAAPAAAQGTWNLGTSSTAAGSCNASTSTPNSAVCGAGVSGSTGGIQATVTAWGNVGAGTNFTQYNLSNNDPSGFGAQQIGGSETGTNGHHAFDTSTTNCGSGGTTTTGCGGTREFMLISFGNAKVNLSALQIGWWGNDADVSVFRWDGNSAASTAGSSLAAGWSLVSSMDVLNNGASCTNMNGSGNCRQMNVADAVNGDVSGATNLYSSWWLISTYAGAGNAAKNLGTGSNDAFKILSFTANVCVGTATGGSTGGATAATNGNGASCTTTGVPEPGSLALAGLAMVGIVATRRRVRGKAD